MKNLITLSVMTIFFLTYFSPLAIADETNPSEKAIKALEGKDYVTAIKICKNQLAADPDNYQYNFILSRAYAYSREWEKALNLIDRMLDLYPQNLDLMLLRSRAMAWKGDYEEADSGFCAVLEVEPANKEALTGRAEIASWKKEFADAREKYHRILAFNPHDPDIHFRIGRVYQWEGNYAKARQFYERAVQLDSGNVEYRRALKRAYPEFVNNYELRYQYQNQGFSDDRSNYKDHQVFFSFKISPDIGSLILKYNRTHRYGEYDTQFGMELYPHLWHKAYANIDILYSPDAIHYPRTSYLLEVYQSLLRAAEISLGYRRMNFENEIVSLYLGSVGYYLGNFYPFFRWFFAPEDEGQNFSWTLNVRRYFSKDSYVALGYGQGSRPFDIITIEDILVGNSWIFLAEWDWYFLKRIHVKLQFTHRNEEYGPTRNALFLATGFRW